MKSQHVNRQWINFSDSLVQNAVWKWLHSFQNKFLFDMQGIYYITRSIKNLTDAEVWCQLDLFIKWRSDVAESTHDWKDVHIIDEHKQSEKDLKPLLL